MDPRVPWPRLLLPALLISCALAVPGNAGAAPATASITLDPTYGPPTTKVKVEGTGFGASETVVIRFDATRVGVTTTDGSGGFSKSVRVPAPAVPGDHAVKAAGRISGLKATATFLVRTDWTKFHFDQDNSGLNPYENVLNPSNVSGLRKAWARWVPSRVTASPAVVGGVVYVGMYDSVKALDAKTGKTLWKFDAGYISSSPAVADGVVYAGSVNGSVYALDAATGTKLWSLYTGNSVWAAPTVVDGVVYVASGNIYALDAATGTELWSFAPGGTVEYSSPAVANGIVYVGSWDHHLYAIDAATGTEVWSYTFSANVWSSPAVANGVAYMGSEDGNVYALDAATGKKLWTFLTGGDVDYSCPAVANGVLYIGSSDHNVYALDATTGTKLWSFATNGIVDSSPAVANGVVYVGSWDHNVYGLDAATGTKVWRFTTHSTVDSSPTVVNGMVFVGSNDGRLLAFSLP